MTAFQNTTRGLDKVSTREDIEEEVHLESKEWVECSAWEFGVDKYK